MSEYLVSLDVYAGPLDVLLRLIEHQELDITRVSLALVADQFLAYVSELETVSASNLGDFLVIAARLLVLKSRVLLPRPAETVDDEDEDWESDLLERLKEYRRFKQVADALREIEESGRRSYPRLAPPPDIEPRLRPGEASPKELFRAFQRALEAHPLTAPVDAIVAPVVVRMGDCVRSILTRAKRYPRVRFSTLMRQARSRLEVIVTFLAMLELIKQQRIQTVQESLFGEIYIEAREPDPDAVLPPLDFSDYGDEEAPGAEAGS